MFKYLYKDDCIYQTTFEEIIKYDNLIDEAKIELNETTEHKLELLTMMKQRHIDLL